MQRERERESVRKRGISGREADETRRRASPANHEAESYYVTGKGEAEENSAQISEICCIDARTSPILNKGRIPSKNFFC